MKLPLHPDQYKEVRELARIGALQLTFEWPAAYHMAFAHGLEDAATDLKRSHNLWEHAEDEKLWNRMMAL